MGAGCSNGLIWGGLKWEEGRTFVVIGVGQMEADSLFRGRACEVRLSVGAVTKRGDCDNCLGAFFCPEGALRNLLENTPSPSQDLLQKEGVGGPAETEAQRRVSKSINHSVCATLATFMSRGFINANERDTYEY